MIRKIRHIRLCLSLLICTLLLSVYPLPPASLTVQASPLERFLIPSRYFPESGHNVGGAFLTFYDEHNGKDIFGLPISEVLNEQGIYIQYFEHASLEIHPDRPERVIITPLGTMLTLTRKQEPAFAHHEAGSPEVSTYFPATGHNLSHQFRAFWENNGGHPIFGAPISEAFIAYDKETQRSTTVQYFERMRLEYRLEYPGGVQEVRPGNIGYAYAQRVGIPDEALAAARPVTILGTSRVPFAPLPGDAQNITLAARQFNRLKVMPGEHVSYLETVGELSSDTGYVPGSAVVGGATGEVIAGGICYLSSAIFQAVFDAGLDILERHSHTLLLPEFNNTPGLDSAVFTSDARGASRGLYDLDLRWRNDMPDPIILMTEVLTHELKVEVWGYSDGRSTTIQEPYIQHSSPPGSLWRYDEQLGECEVRKVGTGTPGMSISVEREVRSASGEVLHDDRMYSSYTPYKDVFLYGPGITPIQDGSTAPAEKARALCRSE